MSQKENSQKAVLTEIQNQAIIVSSQGEVKSQLEAQFQDRVLSQVRDSQASSCVASQGQVLTQAQLATQNHASSQATVASQAQVQTHAPLASQDNVSSQDSVATQAQSVSFQSIVPTLSQISPQSSVTSSQVAVTSQNRRRDDTPHATLIEAMVADVLDQATPSQHSLLARHWESQDARQKNNE